MHDVPMGTNAQCCQYMPTWVKNFKPREVGDITYVANVLALSPNTGDPLNAVV